MQEVKNNNQGSKKERHIVTWTQEEDDILREQITVHGTDNWAIIASKFKDKTTRQCRRRWYTYLNSDFKKGGWSPEEDMLLCEAQKVFGNRWTEIAKVVSGRTDNAVKNRFTTLCKKRAKYEALAKENNNTYTNQNNKRILLQNGFNTDGQTGNAEPVKRLRRAHIPDPTEDHNFSNREHRPSGTVASQQLRPPFSVLVQNFHNNNMMQRHHISNVNEVSSDAENNKTQGTFLKKDDPKIIALIEQAELLSSLAMKVNAENTEWSLENAWKVLQDYLSKTKSEDTFGHKICDVEFDVEDLKDLIEELRSNNEGNQPSWRQPDMQEASPASSDYSTGSTLMPNPATDNVDQSQVEIGSVHQDIEFDPNPACVGQKLRMDIQETGIPSSANGNPVEGFPSCDDQINNNGVVSALSSTEFSSPIQVTPLFRSLAAGIPSPTFSESERNFLLKTFGVESSPNPSNNPAQPPLCKRVLLQNL